MTDVMVRLEPALAEALVQFVWQGAAIGAFAWIALALLRDARPQARYAVACLALLSCALTPVLDVLQALLAGDAPGRTEASLRTLAAANADIDADVLPVALHGIASPWIVVAWAAGAGGLSVRMACGVLWVGHLRRTAGADLDGRWQARVDRLAARLGIGRRVALRLLPGDGTPLTAGWLRPVVLLPVAVAARMPVDLVEALLAHELAHVRRHDYLVNVLQGMVEVLLFYHPVVWWLSHRIRTERELVADDVAATTPDERRRLALALSELARCLPDTPARFPAHPAPAAHGGKLMPRIQQLIRPKRHCAGALLALPLIGAVLAGAAFYAQAHLAAQPHRAAPAIASPAPLVSPDGTARPLPVSAPLAASTAVVAEARPAPAASRAAEPRVAAAPSHVPYAYVPSGEEGIVMSGSLEDIDDIEAAHAKIDSDFLWFRRDGKAWIVRDPGTLARVRDAWAESEPLQAERQALKAQMKQHEAQLRSLDARMQALGGENPHASPEARAAVRNLEALASRAHAVARRQVALERRAAEAGDAERAGFDTGREQLDRQQQAINAEIERHSATLQALDIRMAEFEKPRSELARDIEAENKAIQEIDEKLERIGDRRQRAASAAADRTRALIDEAYRDGRAEPAPPALH